MARVKICGIRREEDICFVNKSLPEYIGFVFAQSPRKVEPPFVKKLCQSLDDRIQRVGVFVNEEAGKIAQIAEECGLDAVQIHGDERVQYFAGLKTAIGKIGNPVEVWKAVRVKDSTSIRQIVEYDVDAYVLDAFTEGSYGGTGKSFDWNLAIEAAGYGRIILAGGLKQENVSEAIRIARPFAVDVSSGVETEGLKDELKIRKFLCAARSYGG